MRGYYKLQCVLIFMVALAMSVVAWANDDTKRRTQRPNIIVVLVDDHGIGDIGRAFDPNLLPCKDPDHATMDHPDADLANCIHPIEIALQALDEVEPELSHLTPHIDQFRVESTRFSDFHVEPVCAPTRAALMTGRSPQRGRVLLPTSDRAILAPDEVTTAEIFKQAGYSTALIGKWNLGDAYPSRPQDRGFDRALPQRGLPQHVQQLFYGRLLWRSLL